MPDSRVTYRRRHSYNTASNKTKVVKTPGGKLVVHYRTKVAKGPRTPGYLGGQALQGLPALRPKAFARLGKNQKRVYRAYGGVLTAGQVKERILRAFLIEEQKIVKKVLKTMKQPASAPAAK